MVVVNCMPKYLIVGGFGYGSLGDEVILHCELDEFNRKDCAVISYDFEETEQMHQVEAYPLKVLDDGRWDFSPFDEFEDFETLIIGGGGIFGNIAAGLLCKFALTQNERGKNTRFYNLGVFEDVCDWRLVKNAFQHADKVTVRNMVSKEIVKKYTGLNVEVDGYISLRCPKASWLVVKEILERYEVDRNKVLVGINCAYDDSIIQSESVSFHTPVCDFLLKQGCELVSINTCIHKWYKALNDALAIKKINTRLEHGQIKNLMGKWGRGIFHPLEIKGIIAELDLLISYRKHPALLAYSEDVPLILTGSAVDRIVDTVRPLGYFPIIGGIRDSTPDDVIDLLKKWLRR